MVRETMMMSIKIHRFRALPLNFLRSTQLSHFMQFYFHLKISGMFQWPLPSQATREYLSKNVPIHSKRARTNANEYIKREICVFCYSYFQSSPQTSSILVQLTCGQSKKRIWVVTKWWCYLITRYSLKYSSQIVQFWLLTHSYSSKHSIFFALRAGPLPIAHAMWRRYSANISND